MLLNRTSRRQVDKIRFELFRRWPTPETMSNADPVQVERVVRSLGLSRVRAMKLVKMSAEFLTKDWVHPSELHGLGQYAEDAYQIFVMRRSVENPADKFLKVYEDWRNTGRIDEVAFAESRLFNTKI